MIENSMVSGDHAGDWEKYDGAEEETEAEQMAREFNSLVKFIARCPLMDLEEK